MDILFENIKSEEEEGDGIIILECFDNKRKTIYYF
jgi:hypothetical protein